MRWMSIVLATLAVCTWVLVTDCTAVNAQESGESQVAANYASSGGLTFDLTSIGNTPISASSVPSAGRTLLKGAIEHSETLPPVDSSFREGLTFDVAKLPKLTPGNSWHWVPNWFAGKWKTETNTCYYAEDLRTRMINRSQDVLISRGQETIGFQRDRQGGIWEYEYKPYIAFVDCGDSISVQMIADCEPVEVTADEVVYRFQSTDIKVQRVTKRILRVAQGESLQTYVPAGRDLIKCTASMKTFDANGKPVILQRNVAESRRIGPFRRVDVYKGKDMCALFQEYLTSRGLADLLPVEASPAPLRAVAKAAPVLGRHTGVR